MRMLKPRDYVIEEYTKTVCPLCFRERQRRSDDSDVFKDGMLVSHDGSIWLRRFCKEHGETESLYEEDAEIWRARNGKAATIILVTQKFALPVAAGAAAIFYALAMRHGKKDTQCVLRWPVLISSFWAVVCLVSLYLILRPYFG